MGDPHMHHSNAFGMEEPQVKKKGEDKNDRCND